MLSAVIIIIVHFTVRILLNETTTKTLYLYTYVVALFFIMFPMPFFCYLVKSYIFY